jgi:high-affinity iron transporter
MLSALIIIFREGFEAFLSVAIILAYLRKTNRDWLRPAVHWGIVFSILLSFALGWWLRNVNKPLWEGVLGVVAAVLVATFVIQLWRTAPRLKSHMEARLDTYTSRTSRALAVLGVFGFTVLMVTREGMETALMLMQVRDPHFLTGCAIGIFAAAGMSWAWAHYGYRVPVKRFFQVTGMFLLLFTVQILFYSFHEFSEAGVLGKNSDAIHSATEAFSPEGLYGKWFSVLMVGICAVWLITVSIKDRLRSNHVPAKTRG